jgi:hypothetical protein
MNTRYAQSGALLFLLVVGLGPARSNVSQTQCQPDSTCVEKLRCNNEGLCAMVFTVQHSDKRAKSHNPPCGANRNSRCASGCISASEFPSGTVPDLANARFSVTSCTLDKGSWHCGNSASSNPPDCGEGWCRWDITERSSTKLCATLKNWKHDWRRSGSIIVPYIKSAGLQ